MDNILNHFESIFDFENILFRADYAADNPIDGDFMDDMLNRYDDDGERMTISEDQVKQLLKIAESYNA
jgi:hypothetical protein